MKGSLKKVSVFVTIAAITIFVVAATASAGDRHGKTIRGVYGWAGPGTCIPTDVYGFPLLNADRFFMTGRGTITFKHDGTGKVLFTGAGGNNAGAFSYEASYDHEYYIAPEGAITIDSVPNTYVQTFLTGPVGLQLFIDFLSLKGWISADHKTITIATPEPSVNKNCYVSRDCETPEYSICNFSYTLVRIGGHEKDTE
jgi:hypothetical protein